MATIVSQIVVLLVNRVLSDGQLTGLMLGGIKATNKESPCVEYSAIDCFLRADGYRGN